MDKKYFVYCHKNKINNKEYIGITGQSNLNKRWNNGKGYSNCTAFDNAIKKYGWNNFEHIILCENLTREQASIMETFLIHTRNTVVPNGYNLLGGGYLGYELSEETRKIISENAKQKIGGDNPNAKEVYVYDKLGNFIEKLSNCKEASSKYKISRTAISLSCNKHRVVKDYQFRFSDKEQIIVSNENYKYQYDLNGKCIAKYKTIAEASRKTGICKTCIAKAIRRDNQISANGYLWYSVIPSEEQLKKDIYFVIHKNFKKVIQMDMEGHFIEEFESVKMASIKTNTNLSSLVECCKGKRSHANNFKWKYAEGVF